MRSAPSGAGLTCSLSQALSVGIFPYVLKLLQSSARELRPLLVFIWAKILAVDSVSNVCPPSPNRRTAESRVGGPAPLSVLPPPSLTPSMASLPPRKGCASPGPSPGLSRWPSAHLLSLVRCPLLTHNHPSSQRMTLPASFWTLGPASPHESPVSSQCFPSPTPTLGTVPWRPRLSPVRLRPRH